VNNATIGRDERHQKLGDVIASSRARQTRTRGSECGWRGDIFKTPDERNWSAFERMYAGSRRSFVTMAYGILQNKEDAEDAVQDALVSSYVHLSSFKGRSALKTWFTRIVINAALMIRRKRKPAEMDSEPEWAIHASSHWMEAIPSPEPDPETSCGKSETLRVIEELIAQLRPTLRQALTLSWFKEIPVGKAPALLGVSTATFKARLFRARRQLISQARRSLTYRSEQHLILLPTRSSAPQRCQLKPAAGFQNRIAPLGSATTTASASASTNCA
jgi:RNA polymerase sigma-70 factor, ECF subfamily